MIPAQRHVTSRAALGMLALTLLVTLSGVLVLNQLKPVTQTADLTKHAQAATAAASVRLTSTLSLRQAGKLTDLMVHVTILNTGDKALAYVGFPCSDPATVAGRSTRPDPPLATYPASATALRALVMQYQRQQDENFYFGHESPDKTNPPAAACDEAAAPTLPPHELFGYTVSDTVAIDGVPNVDAATTDIVTTLKLGTMPQPGAVPAPIATTDVVEIRTPLQKVLAYSRPSQADLATTAKRFDEAIGDPALAAWVDAQAASSWHDARLTKSFTPGSEWSLIAYSRQYAVPLHATGSGGKVLSVRIPTERSSQPAATDAVIPNGATARSRSLIPVSDLYVGDLVLPSGRVMVGDPVSSDSMLTFDLGLKAGRYPVHVVTTRPRYEDWTTTAWEALLLSNLPVTHWEAAVPVGHTAKELKPGGVFTWGTDGATGGFASPEAMKAMDDTLTADMNTSLYFSLGEREEANGWLWGLLTVDSRTGANVFASSTGSDGGFPVLLGLDAQNHPAVLLSDFNALQMDYGGIHAQ